MDEQGKTGWLLPVLVTLIGGFMSVLDSSIVNVALSDMMHVFNVNTDEIEWIVTIYMLVMGVVIPFSGWAGDRFGQKRVYMAALIFFVLGSSLCSISWSVQSLIAARVIQALGGGLIMPVMMTMVRKMVPEGRFASAMGILGVAILLAPALGPTIGGYLVEYVDWRWIFTINIPIGIIGVVLAAFFIPSFPKQETDKLDIPGAICASVMLFSLLLALSEGATWGWTSEPIVLLFYTFVVSCILFIIVELGSRNPLLNIRIFRTPSFTMACILLAISTIGMFSALFYIPLFLQNIKGLGAFQTGLTMLPGALVSGLMMPVCSKLYGKVGPRAMAITGLIFLAFTTYLFHGITAQTSTATIAFWLVLRGVAMPFTQIPVQTIALDVISPKDVGSASSMTNIVSRVSGSFGIAALTGILTSQTSFYAAMTNWGISSSSLGVSGFLQKLGFSVGNLADAPAQLKVYGLSILGAQIQSSAYIQAMDDVFLLTTIIVLVGIIPALFLRAPKHDGDAAAFDAVEETPAIGPPQTPQLETTVA